MNPENTLPIGVRTDSAQWLARQVHAVRCAVCAAISSGGAHCDGSGDRTRQHTLDVRVPRCRGAERRAGAAARAQRERS
jgi:hypothetical protein